VCAVVWLYVRLMADALWVNFALETQGNPNSEPVRHPCTSPDETYVRPAAQENYTTKVRAKLKYFLDVDETTPGALSSCFARAVLRQPPLESSPQ
jgi:hypothetical protein